MNIKRFLSISIILLMCSSFTTIHKGKSAVYVSDNYRLELFDNGIFHLGQHTSNQIGSYAIDGDNITLIPHILNMDENYCISVDSLRWKNSDSTIEVLNKCDFPVWIFNDTTWMLINTELRIRKRDTVDFFSQTLGRLRYEVQPFTNKLTLKNKNCPELRRQDSFFEPVISKTINGYFIPNSKIELILNNEIITFTFSN